MTQSATPSVPPTATARSRALAELTAGMLEAPPEIVVSDVTLDSRAVRPGALFLACRGQTRHGIEFLEQAIAQGARAVLYDTNAAGADCVSARDPKVYVAGVARLSHHVGTIADRFFDFPSQHLNVVGVTGTNGKTTCAWLLAQALTHCGRPAAYVGTLGFGLPGALTASIHTTADAVSVHRQLAALRSLGAECVGLEVSSHALDQSRIDGVRLHVAAFTNLTHDHLDYHGSMQAYGAAKARLFERATLAVRVINIDDPFGAELAARHGSGRLVVTTRSAHAGAAAAQTEAAQFVLAKEVRALPQGLSLEVETSWGSTRLAVPLIGGFNADNVLTVLAVLLATGIPLAQSQSALERCAAPPGRMEAFRGGESGPLAIVDYAHTPDALEKALRAVRAHCGGRLRVVFGCGGDRDTRKRPVMGRIAAELADEVILTDDNPRTEDPGRIVADILGGIAQRGAVRIEHDRERAIRGALTDSGSADVVLIAGKGHEDYQIYGTKRRAFSDQAVVRAHFGGCA